MNILTKELERKIHRSIIENCIRKDYEKAIKNIPQISDELYSNIPDNKRISYGRVYVVKVLSQYIFNQMITTDTSILQYSSKLFDMSNDFNNKGLALGILSLYGQDHFNDVLPYFKAAASSNDWNIREFAQIFFRKLIRTYPNKSKTYLLDLVTSENPYIRRFVAETIRPVQENRWFYKNPEYPLSILSYLFKETEPYPRTSVGNNLSDLARRLPDLVFELVKKLVDSGNKNSYWIAYRACRNLVKKEPIKVMNLLNVDEYKYKNRVHHRHEYQ